MLFLFDQVRTFFFMLGFGFFAGLCFNLYQVILNKFKIRGIIVHISDLFFSIMLGVFGFLLLILVNYGALRFYVIFAIILGFSIYYMLHNLISRENN